MEDIATDTADIINSQTAAIKSEVEAIKVSVEETAAVVGVDAANVAASTDTILALESISWIDTEVNGDAELLLSYNDFSSISGIEINLDGDLIIGYEGTAASPDIVIPVITLLGDASTTVTIDTSYVDAGATAEDNIDGDITASIVTANSVNVNTLGSYTVTYNVVDSSGNTAIEVTRTVVVEEAAASPDIVIPVITLLGDASTTVTIDTSYVDAGATAEDNIDGDITASIVTANSVNVNTLGSYTVTYNVVDSSGNTAIEVTRTVIIAEESADTMSYTSSVLGIVSVDEQRVFDSSAHLVANSDRGIYDGTEAEAEEIAAPLPPDMPTTVIPTDYLSSNLILESIDSQRIFKEAA